MPINTSIPWKDFLADRQQVLETWPTGRGISLEDGVRYQSGIPAEKNFARAMRNARLGRKTLPQPRAGVALIDQHIRLLRYLETEGFAVVTAADGEEALVQYERCDPDLVVLDVMLP